MRRGRPPRQRGAQYLADLAAWTARQRRYAEGIQNLETLIRGYNTSVSRFRRQRFEIGLSAEDQQKLARVEGSLFSLQGQLAELEQQKANDRRPNADDYIDGGGGGGGEDPNEPDRDASENVQDPEPGENTGRGDVPRAETGAYLLPKRKRLAVSSYLLTFNTNHKHNGFPVDASILPRLKGEVMAKLLRFSKWKTNRPENRGMYPYTLMTDGEQEKCRQFVERIDMFIGNWEGITGDPNRKKTTRMHVHAVFNVYHWQYFQWNSSEVHQSMVVGQNGLGKFHYFNYNLLANDFAAFGYILKAGQILNRWSSESVPTRLLTVPGSDNEPMATPLPLVIVPVQAPHSGIDTSSAASSTRAEGRATGNTSTLPPGTVPAFGPPVPLYPEASSRPAAPQPAPGGNAQPARIGIRGTAASHGDPNR